MEPKKNEFERSLTRLSNSLLVTLPSQFVKKHELEKGDTVNVKINNDWSLAIVPKAIVKKGEEEITIEAYREVSREVVEMVLSGSEKITILSDKKISEEIKKEIRFFIGRLPQAEILEEEPQRIVVYKSAGFKDLPSRQLLHRLLQILSEIFKNLRENDKVELEQNFIEINRLYIRLIGILRTFHNIGFLEYSGEDLTQKIASDYRIFSYQLKLIGYILRDFELDDSLIEFFKKIEAYFNAIFDAFRYMNKRLAHELWFRNRDLEQEGRELMERLSNEHKYKITLLLMIGKICRSMTALLYS